MDNARAHRSATRVTRRHINHTRRKSLFRSPPPHPTRTCLPFRIPFIMLITAKSTVSRMRPRQQQCLCCCCFCCRVKYTLDTRFDARLNRCVLTKIWSLLNRTYDNLPKKNAFFSKRKTLTTIWSPPYYNLKLSKQKVPHCTAKHFVSEKK